MLSLQWLAPTLLLVAALVVYVWPQEVQWPAWWSSMIAGFQSTSDAQQEPLEVVDQADPGESATEPAPVITMPVDAPPVLSGSEPASSSSQASSVQPLALDLGAEAGHSLTASQPFASADTRANALVMVVSEPSWVEVRDGSGKRLMSRHVEAGESIGLDGKPPLKVRIGNAGGVQVSYLGHQVELAAFTRNNVARLELK